MRHLLPAMLMLIALLYGSPAQAQSRGGLIIIQDAEVESVLRGYALPLFRAAGLNADALRLFIVKDDSINAFATSGNRIFIHTGLITNAKDYSEVVSVLAHETGHIAGGHLLRLADNVQIAARNSLISTILGGIAGIATGRADVGVAVAMGGMDASVQSFMQYRRSEENAADQIAIGLMDKTGTPLSGFAGMMKTINERERYNTAPTGYLSTHPLSSDRLSFINNQMKDRENAILDAARQEEFLRIKAKLKAFIDDPDKTLREYRGDSYADRYARAIAYFRKIETEKALAELDGLIAAYPNVPYLYEFKGQILFESGRIQEALVPYRKAYALRPDPLIRLSLAQAEIEADDTKTLLGTIADLKKIVAEDAGNAAAYRYLAISSGKTGDLGYAAYYMAEYNFLTGKYQEALTQAKRAERDIPDTAPAWIRIQDIKDAAEAKLKQQKERM